MKKTIFTILLIGILLTGCGQEKQSSTTINNNSSNSNHQHSSWNHSNIKTNESDQSKQKQSNFDHYHYQVPKSYRSNHEYIKNGNLKHVGEFSFDQFGTKEKLDRISNINQSINSGKIKYTIKSIHLFKNKAHNKEALDAVKQVFNLNQISSTYDTIQLKFNVTNRSDQTVNLNGIKLIQINHDQTLSSNQQLNDESAGQTLQPHQSKSMFAMGLINNYNFKHLKLLQIQFNGVYNQHGKLIDPPSRTININY
ncbi:hypothetical protein WR164_09530 [Philodulcilactobacillus myokoensis]|uniref:DUF4352 domain-containing protein n=1 Tax=Philodulcilactobacillus myokoensis TaxID=2929573 RepID=A0A9W6ETF2_9LACO|nr:hypothetical protein [Philodulcilactobacillus myokoensis]GLB46974.1 hypothetical protein WR164_09530 [Philodulcilactobacillus myokoensis]